MNIAKYAFLCLFSVQCLVVNAQKKNANYVRYIEQYKQTAIDQMYKHGIPASITLAQAILESGAGQGDLAKRSNNHFGIKCGSGWTGASVTHDDDKKGECFRKYNQVSESYEDHSLFLKRDRYARLFTLARDDYKGWARGLKECGYATLSTYADRLIKLIDDYELHQYDYGTASTSATVATSQNNKGTYEYNASSGTISKGNANTNTAPVISKKNVKDRSVHTVYSVNELKCVIVQKGDTWYSLSREKGIELERLLKYNEATKNTPLSIGMNVFLQKKRSKAEKRWRGQWHKVQAGENMYIISQRYGIRQKTLYKINYKKKNYVPSRGDILLIRK